MKKTFKSLILILIILSVLNLNAYAYFAGNSRSGIYHYPGCEWAQKISSYNYVTFKAPSEALSYGYRPCYVCYPPTYDSYIYKIVLNSPPQNMHIGDSSVFQWTYWPAGAIDTEISFSSSNPDVAYISEGTVYAKAIGKTLITASTSQGVKYSYTLNVVPIYAKSIKINNAIENVTVFQTYSLSAIIEPSNTTDKSIKWTSSDEKVATISGDGKLYALAEGQCTISANCGNAKDSFNLSVKKVPVQDILIKNEKNSFYINEDFTFDCEITPLNASYPKIEYSSDNPDVISIDDDGKLQVKTPGKCVLTLVCDDIKKKFSVEAYYVKVNEIKVSPILFLYSGNNRKIEVTILPTNASNKNYTMFSANEKIISVDTNTIKAKASGFDKIIIEADGTKIEKLVYVHNLYVDLFIALILISGIVFVIKHKRK